MARAEPLSLEHVRSTVDKNFAGLWPAVEVGLSVAASLLLADNSNPVAVIYVGGPSSSKTTVADLFADHALCYVSDNFTPAAFVSHAANVKKKALAEVDLLPRIKHKVLVTPEMAPIFRGKEDELAQRFSTITRVLDGQGLMTDSGTHGRRGYRGDYLFAWLGCTTPFEPKVWRVMAQLGSRLFFLIMDTGLEVTPEELLASDTGPSYRERLKVCTNAIHPFLTALLVANGIRRVKWVTADDPKSVREWIARFAALLAAMRSEPQWEADPDDGRPGLTPAKREQPRRAYAVLRNLARGRALIYGRRQLAEDDLPMVARVVVSSMPAEAARVFPALVQAGPEGLPVAHVQASLEVRHPETARGVMDDLGRHEVMEVIGGGQGHPAHLRFRQGWGWCASPEFRAILAGEPVKNRGVCDEPSTSDQAQRQEEREGVEEKAGDTAHTPGEMTGSSCPGPDSLLADELSTDDLLNYRIDEDKHDRIWREIQAEEQRRRHRRNQDAQCR